MIGLTCWYYVGNVAHIGTVTGFDNRGNARVMPLGKPLAVVSVSVRDVRVRQSDKDKVRVNEF